MMMVVMTMMAVTLHLIPTLLHNPFRVKQKSSYEEEE